MGASPEEKANDSPTAQRNGRNGASSTPSLDSSSSSSAASSSPPIADCDWGCVANGARCEFHELYPDCGCNPGAPCVPHQQRPECSCSPGAPCGFHALPKFGGRSVMDYRH